MTDALPLKTSQVNAYTMKLVEKKHANSSDELLSIERKVRHLELDNVRLRAASLNAKKKLARMKHVKPEIHRRETIPTVDFSAEESTDTISSMATPQHIPDEQEFQMRLASTRKVISQRLKHAEDFIESQQVISMAMESSAANTIKLLREKLRRVRKSALSKKLAVGHNP